MEGRDEDTSKTVPPLWVSVLCTEVFLGRQTLAFFFFSSVNSPDWENPPSRSHLRGAIHIGPQVQPKQPEPNHNHQCNKHQSSQYYDSTDSNSQGGGTGSGKAVGCMYTHRVVKLQQVPAYLPRLWWHTTLVRIPLWSPGRLL